MIQKNHASTRYDGKLGGQHDLLLRQVWAAVSDVQAGGRSGGPISASRQRLALSLAEMLCHHSGLGRLKHRFYWQLLQDQLRYLSGSGFGGEVLEAIEPRFPGWMARLNNAAHHGELGDVRQVSPRSQDQAGSSSAAYGAHGTQCRPFGVNRHTVHEAPFIAEDQFLGNFRDHWSMHVAGR